MFYAEGPRLEFWGAGCKLPIASVKQAVTSAVCELKKALVAAIPGAEVHWAAGGPREYTLICGVHYTSRPRSSMIIRLTICLACN